MFKNPYDTTSFWIVLHIDTKDPIKLYSINLLIQNE